MILKIILKKYFFFNLKKEKVTGKGKGMSKITKMGKKREIIKFNDWGPKHVWLRCYLKYYGK
jgi:hypothetical protein